jgi:hypothetical protein
MDALVGVTSPAKLQLLVRVGHTLPPALSPRCELQNIIVAGPRAPRGCCRRR